MAGAAPTAAPLPSRGPAPPHPERPEMAAKETRAALPAGKRAARTRGGRPQRRLSGRHRDHDGATAAPAPPVPRPVAVSPGGDPGDSDPGRGGPSPAAQARFGQLREAPECAGCHGDGLRVPIKERKKSQEQRDEISSFFIIGDHQKSCTEGLISKNTETKQMEKVTHLEGLLFSAVLENCVDQLAILGYIMPVSHEGKTDISHTGIQEMKEMIETQEDLDINHPELMSAKQESGETVTSTALKNTKHKQQLGKTEDRKSTHHFSKSSKKPNTLSAEKLRKIQADRQYASDVITVTMKKMQELGTFNSLTEANEREKEKKSKFYEILIREEKGKKEIKSLQKQLQDVKKQIEKDLQNRDKAIDRLKDKLQEKTAKLNTESYYMKKNTDLQVHLTQKMCSNAENALDKEIQNLKSKTDEEIQLHTETENFLMQECQKVEARLEYWKEKYEKDTNAKDEELDDLRALMAENLEMMQRFAKECLTFQVTIITDRSEKEARRKQKEQDALELKSALKVQSWWRGTMVRRFLGPYQELEKLLKEQPSVQKETGKEKSRAKR